VNNYRSSKGRLSRAETIAEIVQSLRRIFKAIQVYSKQALREFGVTGPQLWALRVLKKSGPISVGELAEAMYLHISTVSGLVDRLEGHGLAERLRHPSDGRVIQTQLTEEGRRLLKKAPEPAQGKLLHGLERLDRRSLRQIHQSVAALVEIMEVQDVKATFFFEEV
jgi:DNA-binding MarR family transcriptional regulator